MADSGSQLVFIGVCFVTSLLLANLLPESKTLLPLLPSTRGTIVFFVFAHQSIFFVVAKYSSFQSRWLVEDRLLLPPNLDHRES